MWGEPSGRYGVWDRRFDEHKMDDRTRSRRLLEDGDPDGAGVYGDVVKDQMAEAHSKVVELALKSTHAARISS